MHRKKKSTAVPLQQMPSYKAPEQIWDRIQDQLEKDQRQGAFKNALNNLPVYKAPEATWVNIREKLAKDSGVYPMLLIRAVAAIGIILIGLLLWVVISPDSESEVTYSFARKTLDEAWQVGASEGDESAFGILDDWCQAHSFVCHTPEFISLKSEFDELSKASTELKEAIGAYNDSPDLIRQWTAIEMERTEIFKKLIVLL